MAKKSARDELIETLRARGLRRRAASIASDAITAGRGGADRGTAGARKVITDLRSIADELEERLTGKKSASRKEAAKKAARTRARKADARSASAKKAAATRKTKSAGRSASTKAKSTGRSASTKAKSTGRRASTTKSRAKAKS